MWAVDDRLIGQAGQYDQQWIEIYNTSSIPVANDAIPFVFTNNAEGLNPPPEIAAGTSDRLSNINTRTNVWDLKGSSRATSTVDDGEGEAAEIIGADPQFKSMIRSQQGKNGFDAGSWAESTRLYIPGFLGTPGGKNTRAGLPTARGNPSAFTPPKDKLIINEVYNDEDDDLDWIELRNVSDDDVNLEKWRLSYTTNTGTANGDEKLIIWFPKWVVKDSEVKEDGLEDSTDLLTIPAGEVLLIVNTDPEDTDLIAGQDIAEDDIFNQTSGAGSHKYLNMKRSHEKDLHIPSSIKDGGFLILRTPANSDKDGYGGRVGMHDVAGPSRQEKNTLSDTTDVKEAKTGNFWKTKSWPINGQDPKAFDAKDTTNNNAHLDPDASFEEGEVWARNGTNHGWRKDGGSHADFNGAIGYDRSVRGAGTPGYHNDVMNGNTDNITEGRLIISELMITTDNGRSPQWIELHNTSRTKGIDLSYDIDEEAEKVIAEKVTGWQMIIENHNSGSWREDGRPVFITLNLKDLGDITYIPPNQTVLIASTRTSRRPRSYFPDHRVASVWGASKAVRDAFGMKNSKSSILNAEGGFYIKIVDGAGNVSDEIGNLDGVASNVRKGIGIDDAYSWHWPTDMTEDDNRTSLIRLMNDGTRGVQGENAGVVGTPRVAVPDRTVDLDITGAVLPIGTRWRGGAAGATGEYLKYAWVHAVDTGLDVVDDTYYGREDDYSTPLHTIGTPLPVSLSYFRPNLENGKVVIRWTTESELDNAGFNILRGDSRNGEFKQVNSGLVQGAGTTGERNAYKWVDESAKPGVVYYYQIEDVSFAGEHQTLTTTKLKGLISANNKLTTLWGGLKSQD